MPSIFIQEWLTQTDNQIYDWLNNGGNPNLLRPNLTNCCLTNPVSYDHFPEPYYGNPDDSKEKSAVVLFYNPGPPSKNQHIDSRGEDTFYYKYSANDKRYSILSSKLEFCENTINGFLNPKNTQLNHLFNFIPDFPNNLRPFFMDIIPWHSDNFKRLSSREFLLPITLNEFKNEVIIPATFIAKNSLLTRYLNSLSKDSNKIVFLAIGALYSNQKYLHRIGFHNITNLIPLHPGHMLQDKRIITNQKSRIAVWYIKGDKLMEHNEVGIESDFNEKEIYIINLWTQNIGMNIPNNIQTTLEHVLLNL